jgi:hypothetical protein
MKFLRVVLDILYHQKSYFTRKRYFLCVMCKKTKFGAKIDVAQDIFVVLHKTQKISVFHETCHVHIKCQDVHAKFLFMIF